jgi:hypothetical protein
LRAVNITHDIGDSQNTTKYLLATARIQNSNNYMFRSFLVAIIRLYIPRFNIMYNMPTKLAFYIKQIPLQYVYTPHSYITHYKYFKNSNTFNQVLKHTFVTLDYLTSRACYTR